MKEYHLQMRLMARTQREAEEVALKIARLVEKHYGPLPLHRVDKRVAVRLLELTRYLVIEEKK